MARRKQQPFWQRVALIVLAAFVMAFTIKSFARPGGIFSGGFNGISLLIIACFEKFAGISPPFALVNYTLNLIPLYISFRYLGKKLTVLSVLRVPDRRPARLLHHARPPAGCRLWRYLQRSGRLAVPAGQRLGRRHRYHRSVHG